MNIQRTFLILVIAALSCAAPPARADEQMVLGSDGRLALGKKGPVAQTTQAEVNPSLSSASMKTAGILLMMMGLAGAALLWARRQRNGGVGRIKAEENMALLERLSVGPRRELLLVRAGNRVLVLASLQQDLKLVSSMPANAVESAADNTASEQDFAQLLSAAAPRRALQPTPQTDRAPQTVAEAYGQPAPRAQPRTRQAAPETTSPLDLVDWPELPVKA